MVPSRVRSRLAQSAEGTTIWCSHLEVFFVTASGLSTARPSDSPRACDDAGPEGRTERILSSYSIFDGRVGMTPASIRQCRVCTQLPAWFPLAGSIAFNALRPVGWKADIATLAQKEAAVTSMFTRPRKGQGHWRIEGIEGTTTFYEAVLPGNLNDDEITTIIQRLASRHLTEDEIIGASLRKNRRTALLEPLRSRGGPSSRHIISIDHGIGYVASYWRAGETIPTNASGQA
jgi:hypothetical protein